MQYHLYCDQHKEKSTLLDLDNGFLINDTQLSIQIEKEIKVFVNVIFKSNHKIDISDIKKI